MQSLMRCSVFRNLLLIELVQGMISLLLVLLLLVLLFLFLLVIMLNLKTMVCKMCQLVRTQTMVNLSQEHPLSRIRKRSKTLGLRRETLKKPKQKKQYLCHHYRAAGYTRPNYYKCLATEQSNSMISLGNQNQFPSSFAPLGDLLKAFMFLSNLNDFNSSPSLPDQEFAKRKDSSKV